jgi:hypothetical protein
VRAVDVGVGVSVLGVDLAADEIASAARRAGVKAVGLGLVNGDNCAAAGRQIAILERGLPQEVELWLGGPQARTVAQLLGATRAIVLDQEQSLEAEMQRLRSLSAAKM